MVDIDHTQHDHDNKAFATQRNVILYYIALSAVGIRIKGDLRDRKKEGYWLQSTSTGHSSLQSRWLCTYINVRVCLLFVVWVILDWIEVWVG